MKVIIDENVHQYFIQKLSDSDYDVILIAEESQGISDIEVIEHVEKQEGILITEDSDFGELVFAHDLAKLTVVFLRYRKPEMEKVCDHLLLVVEEYLKKEGQYFIVITSTRIRIRQL